MERTPAQDGEAAAPIPISLKALLFGAAVVLALWSLQGVVLGDSANSRFATVYSLVHDGTWYIDRPWGEARIPYERGTVDKAEVDGRLLSTKPPVMPLAMTAVYFPLHHGLGWSLLEEAEAYRIARVTAFALSVVPYLLVLIVFVRFLRWFPLAPWKQAWLLAALIFGVQLSSYAGQINNHLPGACFVIVSLYLAFGLFEGKSAPAPWRFAVFGLASALVFALDMPMTIFPALAGFALLYRFPKEAWLYGGLGAAPVLAVHFGFLYYVTGSVLPLQLYPEKYLFQGSFWRHPTGLDGLNEPKPLYFFHMTLGRHGAFLLFPVLLLGIVGMVKGATDATCCYRRWILGALAAFAVLFAYYVFNTNNYGGAAYGFRWLIGGMPVLLLLTVPVLCRTLRPWQVALMTAMLLVGAGSMIECLIEPWGEDREWTVRYLFGPSF